MAKYGNNKIYPGANYGFDPWYGSDDWSSYGNNTGYSINTGTVGFPSDPRTANQIKAVSDKLNTGAKVIEVSGVNITQGGHMGLLDAIPKQQFDEIRRLKELTGVDLTFHGPLVEASGLGTRGEPFEETQRMQAEREIWRTLEQAHRLNPDKSSPVVFHSSSLGAPLETIHMDKSGKPVVTEMLVMEKDTGALRRVSSSQFQTDYLAGGKKLSLPESIEKQNEEEWKNQLSGLSFSTFQARDILERALDKIEIRGKKEDVDTYLDYYKKFVKEPEKAQAMLSKMPPETAKIVEDNVKEIMHGETYVKGQYKNFQDMYNKAYAVAESSGNEKDQKALDDYRKEILPKIESYQNDPSKAQELINTIIDGINVLRRVAPPQNRVPLRKFMIDKSSETFANSAIKAFEKYKDNAPVIAIENPPVGQFALGHADELVDLVKTTRNKFVERATAPTNQGGLGLNKKQAEKQAEKLIGLTWDTAHINTLQGMGYTEKQVLKEAEKAAPFVKHVHISDNFGLADTELPPGMGNAPIEKTLKLIEGYNKQVKKIVETGDWYSKMGLQRTPVLESFSGLGGSVYASLQQGPYWPQTAYGYMPYFGGLGEINPSIHHSTYGAGFSGMPAELGGQMPGGQSRAGGTPIQ